MQNEKGAPRTIQVNELIYKMINEILNQHIQEDNQSDKGEGEEYFAENNEVLEAFLELQKKYDYAPKSLFLFQMSKIDLLQSLDNRFIKIHNQSSYPVSGDKQAAASIVTAYFDQKLLRPIESAPTNNEVINVFAEIEKNLGRFKQPTERTGALWEAIETLYGKSQASKAAQAMYSEIKVLRKHLQSTHLASPHFTLPTVQPFKPDFTLPTVQPIEPDIEIAALVPNVVHEGQSFNLVQEQLEQLGSQLKQQDPTKKIAIDQYIEYLLEEVDPWTGDPVLGSIERTLANMPESNELSREQIQQFTQAFGELKNILSPYSKPLAVQPDTNLDLDRTGNLLTDDQFGQLLHTICQKYNYNPPSYSESLKCYGIDTNKGPKFLVKQSENGVRIKSAQGVPESKDEKSKHFDHMAKIACDIMNEQPAKAVISKGEPEQRWELYTRLVTQGIFVEQWGKEEVLDNPEFPADQRALHQRLQLQNQANKRRFIKASTPDNQPSDEPGPPAPSIGR